VAGAKKKLAATALTALAGAAGALIDDHHCGVGEGRVGCQRDQCRQAMPACTDRWRQQQAAGRGGCGAHRSPTPR
jgi:hypothetical protein